MTHEEPAVIVRPEAIDRAVMAALDEDVGAGDVTGALLPAAGTLQATVVTREQAVVCGRPWFDRVFARLDPRVRVQWLVDDGAEVSPGDVLCRLDGPARALLAGERAGLNFLQTLSATATLTRGYVRQLAGRCRLLDTRKTIPGLRVAQKYAVRVGGGDNHRHGLFDEVLLKENHIAALGGVGPAVRAARARYPDLVIVVEVETLAEFETALGAPVDRILLDNFSLADIRTAVAAARAAPQPKPLEVSGGVAPDAVEAIARTGVDAISVGALTKNLQAIDLSMRIKALKD